VFSVIPLKILSWTVIAPDPGALPRLPSVLVTPIIHNEQVVQSFWLKTEASREASTSSATA
jgi:hypothetical protein